MKIYAMMFDDEIKYVSLSKAAAEKVVQHQLFVDSRIKDSPFRPKPIRKIYLAEMSGTPTPIKVGQARDAKGRFVKNS